MLTRFLTLPLLSIAIALGQPATPADSARVLIHLLDYLAQDYGGAVQNGKVISIPEYEEQKEFAEKAWSLRHAFADSVLSHELETKLSVLKESILSQAEPDSVGHLALEIKNSIIRASGIQTAPTKWPNLAGGQRLFAQNCAVCHGPFGHGDGPSASGLNPKPADFHNEARMSSLSAFQVFNTVRLGVEGTAMPAFGQLSEEDIWNLAFHVLSLRYRKDSAQALIAAAHSPKADLQRLSLLSEKELEAADPEINRTTLAAWRLQSGESAPTLLRFLYVADSGLDRALILYREGKSGQSADTALFAYMDGIEPLEPRLKANDPALVANLEATMLAIRTAVRSGASQEEVEKRVASAKALLDVANGMLKDKPMPAWALFLVTLGILLRESFEALLVILAILGVIRATKTPKAGRYVHAGWLAALAAGFAAWIFSGWLEHLSGAGRELTEAVSSLFAVAVLMYMGFWMHSKTEIGKWNAFIRERLGSVLNGKGLFGLGLFSFLVVFREAFETVLFLSALNMEGEGAGKPILAGVVAAIALTLILAWFFLRASARIPVRAFFSVSSIVMAFLAVVLAGKGIHALQEAGHMSVTALMHAFRFEFLGIFPTLETMLSQAIVLLICILMLARKDTRKTQANPARAVSSQNT